MSMRVPEVPVGYTHSPLGLLVPERRRRRYDLPVAIDLFAGAGGFSCGLHQAGFHVAAAVETWVPAVMTYLVNLAQPGVKVHFDTAEREREFNKAAAGRLGLAIDNDGHVTGPDPKRKGRHLNRHGLPVSGAGSGWISGHGRSHNPDDYPNKFLAKLSEPPAHAYGCEHMFVADIRNVTGAQILDALQLDVGDVALVVGGPPCQGFSAAGQRNVMDPRNSLVFEFARLVCEIMPRTFAMENVLGIESMVTAEGLPVLDALALAFDDGGYGEYDALRRALSSRERAQGVVRGAKRVRKASKAKKPRTAKQKAPAVPAEPAQLDMFVEAVS